MVVDDTAGKTGEDRREGRQTRAVRLTFTPLSRLMGRSDGPHVSDFAILEAERTNMRVIIVGGAGRYGRATTYFLANDPLVSELVIADKDVNVAQAFADKT